MDTKQIEELRKRFDDKTNEELKAIWLANDRKEWSDEAFAAVEQILRSRGQEVAAQNPVEIPVAKCPKCGSTESKKAPSVIAIIVMILWGFHTVDVCVELSSRPPNLVPLLIGNLFLLLVGLALWFSLQRRKCTSCGKKYKG